MACCLTTPSLDLNQGWFVNYFLWHSPDDNFISNAQCTRKTFMIHQTFVRWALYILFKFVKSLIGHLGLAIGNVWCVRWFSWTLNAEDINHQIVFENCTFKIIATSPWGQWVKWCEMRSKSLCEHPPLTALISVYIGCLKYSSLALVSVFSCGCDIWRQCTYSIHWAFFVFLRLF